MKTSVIVQVRPRARRTETAGRFGDAFRIRLAAVPVDGAANDELIRFLATRLAVPPSAITIVAGHAGRRKRVEVDGVSRDEFERRLGARTGERG